MSQTIDSRFLEAGLNQITIKWKPGKTLPFLNSNLAGGPGIRRDRCLAYVPDPLTGDRLAADSLTGDYFQWSRMQAAATATVKKKPVTALLSLGKSLLDPTYVFINEGRLSASESFNFGGETYLLGGQAKAERTAVATQNGKVTGLESGWWLSGLPLVWDGEANTNAGFMQLAAAGNLYELTDWVCLPYLGPYGYLGVDQIAAKGKFPYEFDAGFKNAVTSGSKFDLDLKIDSESIRKGEDRFSWLNKAVRRSFTKQKHLGEVNEAGDVFLRRLETMSLNFQAELRPRLALGIHEDGSWLAMYVNGRATEKEATGISMAGMAAALKEAGATHALQIDSGSGIGLMANDLTLAVPESGNLPGGLLFY